MQTEERLSGLETRVSKLEKLVRGYIAILENDPEEVEQTAQILRVIRKYPGASQRGICRLASRDFGISRGRALEILSRETGVLWRTAAGAFNSKLYFERERNTQGQEPAHQSTSQQ